MYRRRLRRNVIALFFIIIAGSIALLTDWYNTVNKYYEIEDMNTFQWQKNMNEEEYAKLEKGMSYLEVVEVVKGTGKQVEEGIYIWEDEILLTQGYEIHFNDGKLENKKIFKKRGYSNR
ncbi:MAG TPA: hypothetical protein VNS08_13090 [Ureibacillus sp.]|nr:hypothetical protein [Ureibacillus sp.]